MAAPNVAPALTCAVRRHVPTAVYVTVRLLAPTVHDADPDVTDLVPSPFVLTMAVKLPPTMPFAGDY